MNKSVISHANLDEKSRLIKSKKIITILEENTNLNDCNLLEIDTGSGIISSELAKHSKTVSSVDINDERLIKSGYFFQKVVDENLPFEDNKFDVVVSNHVIEHIPNQELHIDEIQRVLKKNGTLYLATPNKFWLIEAHHRLPFIGFLPRKISSFILKIIKNKEWDIYPLSFEMIKKLTKRKFEIRNFTIEIIKNPSKYHIDVFKIIHFLLKLIPRRLIILFNFFVPDYIIIAKSK